MYIKLIGVVLTMYRLGGLAGYSLSVCVSLSVGNLVCICCYWEGVQVLMLVFVDWECTVAGIIEGKEH